MGIPGWGPVQYREILEDALAHKPNLVIVGFYFGNDLFDAYQMTHEWDSSPVSREQHLKGSGSAESQRPTDEFAPSASLIADAGRPVMSLRAKLFQHVRLHGLVRAAWYEITQSELGFWPYTTSFRDDYWEQLKKIASNHPDDMIVVEGSDAPRSILTPRMRYAGVDPRDTRIQQGIALTIRRFEEMNERCERANCKFIVVLLPTKERVYYPAAHSHRENTQLTKLNEAELRVTKQLLDVFKEDGIESIDPTNCLLGCLSPPGGMNPYFESMNAHFSAAGHKAIASAVANHPRLAIPRLRTEKHGVDVVR
jgi:hypothetical protein